MILSVKDLNVYYGMIHAVKDISFEVNKGEIIALIGANGAGKTTILQAISGLIPSKSGIIKVNDTIIQDKSEKKQIRLACHEVLKNKMAQVPEGRRIFPALTVMENLEMGAYIMKDKKQIQDNFEMIFQYFPRLKERTNQLAGTLSGGEQQMLAMGRAMMSNPDILLLDEPSMGLSPILIDTIFTIIQELNKMGTTILVVEQNAKMALSIANRAYVLETGKIILNGPADDIMNNPAVKAAYLGE